MRWAAVLTLCVGSAVAGGFRVWQRYGPGSAVVMPADMSRLDPELASLIERQAKNIRAHPRDPVAHARLGLVYEANAMFDEARRCFANAVNLKERVPLWEYHMANMMRQAGDFDGALELLRELATKYPKFAPLHHRLGDTLLESGEVEEAAAAFQQAIDFAPAAPAPHVGLADAMICQGDYAGAVELLERAVSLDPRFKAAHYSLGRAFRALGRSEDAERELRKGLNAPRRYMPDALSEWVARFTVFPAGRIQLAETLREAGKPKQAAALLEKGLASRPDEVSLVRALAKVYGEQGRYQNAFDLLLREEGLESATYTTYVSLAICCLKMQRLDEALRYADRAVELSPTIPQTHLARARVLFKRGTYAGTLAELETVAELDSRHPELLVLLGATCLKLHRYEEAEEHLQTAIELAPDSLPAYLNLCEMYIELGQLCEAESALETARRLSPRNPRARALEQRLAEIQED